MTGEEVPKVGDEALGRRGVCSVSEAWAWKSGELTKLDRRSFISYVGASSGPR